jgi:hypothetical protein
MPPSSRPPQLPAAPLTPSLLACPWLADESHVESLHPSGKLAPQHSNDVGPATIRLAGRHADVLRWVASGLPPHEKPPHETPPPPDLRVTLRCLLPRCLAQRSVACSAVPASSTCTPLHGGRQCVRGGRGKARRARPAIDEPLGALPHAGIPRPAPCARSRPASWLEMSAPWMREVSTTRGRSECWRGTPASASRPEAGCHAMHGCYTRTPPAAP